MKKFLFVGAFFVISGLCLRGFADTGAIEQAISSHIKKHYGELHACFRKSLATDRTRGGTVFFELTLGQKGVVEKAKILRDELDNKQAARCMLTVVKGWRLESVMRAGVAPGNEIQLPLTFRPATKQYAVRLKDIPREEIAQGSFRQRVLHPKNVGATKASLTLLRISRDTVQTMVGKATDQALYVLDGKARVRVGKQRWTLSKKAALWLPPKAVALIRAAGKRALVAHIVVPGTAASKHGLPSEALGTKAIRQDGIVAKARRQRRLLVANGKLVVTPLLHQGNLGHSRFYLGLLKAKAGLNVKPHAHLAEAEVLYLFAGKGQMHLEGVPVEAQADQACYLPAGREHALRVDKEIVALQIYAPAGPEQRFFKAARKKK